MTRKLHQLFQQLYSVPFAHIPGIISQMSNTECWTHQTQITNCRETTTWTVSRGPAAGSLFRWITIPLSHLFIKCALPLMSYKFGGAPTQLCNCQTRYKVRELTRHVKNRVLQLFTCLGCATNQTWQEWCWANRLTLVSIWLTYSVSVLLQMNSLLKPDWKQMIQQQIQLYLVQETISNQHKTILWFQSRIQIKVHGWLVSIFFFRFYAAI